MKLWMRVMKKAGLGGKVDNYLWKRFFAATQAVAKQFENLYWHASLTPVKLSLEITMDVDTGKPIVTVTDGNGHEISHSEKV